MSAWRVYRVNGDRHELVDTAPDADSADERADQLWVADPAGCYVAVEPDDAP